MTDLDMGSEAQRLRERLRRLIQDHFPPGFLGAFSDDPADLQLTQSFCERLANEGLLALAWPDEYGGADASVWEQTVVREEMWAHHEPRGAQYMGLNWVGPAVMRFGTDDQKEKHLPPITAGEVIWCQGFSEPEAGSDLAALQTRARSTDTGWRVTGQKIWTSYAAMADWCFLAVRTSEHEDRHQGISIFLVPMDREGIEVRPIDSMLGPHHLNEVFYDDVLTYPSEVLGEVGQGWEVIRESLAFERVGIARYARADRLLNAMLRRSGGSVVGLPSGLRSRFMRSLVRTRIARLMAYEVVAAQDGGEVDDAAAAAARIASTVNDQDTADVLAEATRGRFMSEELSDPLLAAIEDYWRYSRAATVAAGTIEIQRILVARSVLGKL